MTVPVAPSLAEAQRYIDRLDTGALLNFIERSGLREENGHIYIPKGFKESAGLTLAINYLCEEWDYSAGETPETTREP